MEKIDITGVDLVKFVKEVYNLSSPQGMGFLHFTSDLLTDAEAREIVDRWKNDKQTAVDMDYVKGRACKMTVFRKEDRLFIRTPWYDHVDSSLQELLKRCGIKEEVGSEKHNPACNCWNCQLSRGNVVSN